MKHPKVVLAQAIDRDWLAGENGAVYKDGRGHPPLPARLGAARPSDFRRVVVDTMVQEKNITHPTGAKLMDTAWRRLARLAKTHGVRLRQSYARVGKRLTTLREACASR